MNSTQQLGKNQYVDKLLNSGSSEVEENNVIRVRGEIGCHLSYASGALDWG